VYSAPVPGFQQVTTYQQYGSGGIPTVYTAPVPSSPSTMVVQCSSTSGYSRYTSGIRCLLRVHHGKYLHAEYDKLKAHHGVSDNCYFTVKHLHDDIVELTTYNGKYVAIGSGGRVYTTKGHHEHDTKFHLENHKGKVAFRAKHHNRYLGIHFYDSTVRGHHALTNDELFEEIVV